MEIYETDRMQEQEGLLKAIEHTDICMFWYYPKEKRITMSERTARMYRCRREYRDMPESFADDFVHPSTRDGFFKMYDRIDAGETCAQASFSSLDRKNWCTVTMTTVSRDPDGMPEQTYGIVQNISEMKIQEAEYHSSRRKLFDIIGALSKIYMFNYYIDLDTGKYKEIVGLDYITETLGETGDAAAAFRQFTNTLIDEKYKEEFRLFVDLDTLAERIGERQNISLEYLSIRKGWCRASFIVVNRAESGLPAQVEFVVENISAEREKELKAREELERAYEAANRANASKSSFLNNMSHDIRTPMNAIVGFAAIAGAHIDEKERVQDCIDKISASSRHLLSIINEVLDMSRIESGKMQIQEQEANLRTILHDFTNMIQGQARARDLELAVDLTGLQHEHVYADEGRLQRVLLNLVGNAVKFTPEGGRIDLCVREKPLPSVSEGDRADLCAAEHLRLSEPYVNYVIKVRDTGIGMSPEFLPRVFEVFERERTSTVSQIEGTGLGLPITKSIVEMMGGTISVRSEQGKGSEFTIELPLRLLEEERTEVLEEPLAGVEESLTGKQILLVEDNELNREIALELLTEAGFVVDTANDGQEAVEKMEAAPEWRYDIVLMDIQMPVMDGYEAVRRIRAMEKDWIRELPILAMTANAFEEDRMKALAAGMYDHLAKPIDTAELFRTLNEVLCRGKRQ